eukprot:TCONS_00062094-protein
MNNSTTETFSLETGPPGGSLILYSITLCLHFAVQWVIYKLRLHTSNNYYLIRVLSLTDSLAGSWVLFFVLLKGVGIKVESIVLKVVLSSFLMSSNSMSLVITMLIVTDRWIAIQFALRYHALVTRRKINIAILISSVTLIVIFISLLFCQTKQAGQIVQRNQYSLFFSGGLRSITCVYIIVFAKLTLKVRNQNEARIQNITNFHGTEAERLDIISKLTRSIKDVWKLNIWTCFFLVPRIFSSIFQVYLPIQMINDFKIFIFLPNAIYLISNPIVYLFCFTKIRQYWYRTLIARNSVNDNETV